MRRKDCPAPFIKECLAQALFQLMETKNFEDITISEICKVAGFGRTTYYHYFTNKKEELMIFLCDKKWKEEIKPFDSDDAREFDKWCLSVLELVYGFRNQLTLLFKQGLLDTAFKILFNGVRDSLIICKNVYAASFIAGSFYGVVNQWVIDDFSVTPGTISTQLLNSCIPVLYTRKD